MDMGVIVVIAKILYTPQIRALKGITITTCHLKLLKSGNTSVHPLVERKYRRPVELTKAAIFMSKILSTAQNLSLCHWTGKNCPAIGPKTTWMGMGNNLLPIQRRVLQSQKTLLLVLLKVSLICS